MGTKELQEQFNKVNSDWKLIGHSHQIADTGDYDGYYEITNGNISLLTQDDDDESLQPIVDALNDSGCKFYQDDWFEFENKMLQEDAAGLRERVKELETATNRALEILERRRQATPELGASIIILKTALED